MSLLRLAGYAVVFCLSFALFPVCVSAQDFVSVPTNPKDTADSISIRTTGATDCTAGQPCMFEITVTNNGAGEFDGKIAIVDGITDAAGDLVAGTAVVSVVPEFGCVMPPESLPFGCVANVTLAARESRTHKVTVIVPDTKSTVVHAVLVEKKLRNCILIGEPAILDAELGDGLEGAGASINEESPRYACHDFNQKVEKTNSCSNGMVLTASGSCQCPSGTRWNGRRCFARRVFIPVYPPVMGRDPVCPGGMTRFKSFTGKPVGYFLRTVRSNGKRIICGAPRCTSGWKLYHRLSVIPKGWRKKRIGGVNHRYGFWCARPASARICLRANELNRNGICVCISGFKRNHDGQCVTKSVTPLKCWSGWRKIYRGQRASYRQKGYRVKPRREGRRTIWCARPGKPGASSYCTGKNEVKQKGGCVCRRGFRRNRKYQCVRRSVGAGSGTNIPVLCWNGWKKIPRSRVGYYQRKGYSVKSKRSRPGGRVWCVKPVRGKKTPSCTQFGKLGKWPKCYNKPKSTFYPAPRKTPSCTQFGKLGKWPKCYNRPDSTYSPKSGNKKSYNPAILNLQTRIK
jgi:hypothetical protein